MTAMTTELKPCPFCGGEAELIVTEETWMGPAVVLVKCKNGPCSCQTPTLVLPTKNSLNCAANVSERNAEEEAIKIWNRRVEV